MLKRIENSKDQEEEGKKICIELIEQYKGIKGIHGVHLMGYHQEQQIALEKAAFEYVGFGVFAWQLHVAIVG